MSDKPTPEIGEVWDTHPMRLACNAFQSAATRLNVNPVELAESLQDGGIADMVEAIDHTLRHTLRGGASFKLLTEVLATIPKPETET